MQVSVDGEIIADSKDIIRVDEDGSPSRFYFPRADVRMGKLTRNDTSTDCPFKGRAHYFAVNAGRKRFEDAVWSYEAPFEAHSALQNRLAFYDDKIPELEVRPAAH